jgi:hypothetical protein
MTIQKVILSLLLLPLIASAQSFNVFDLDTSEYPIMKAKFYSIDEKGDQILNHTTSDFEITENGNPAEVLSVSCPESLPIPISVGIMVDTYSRINLARHGAERFVNFLNMPQNELGITYMDGRPLLYRDFTNDKKKARESSRKIPRAPGYTNVENMFFDDFSGGIKLISDRETQNRVLIYISDLHCPNLTVDEPKLIQQAKDNNIRIYSVLLGTNDYTGLFRRIASNTNGVVFENLKDSLEIEDVFNEILFREQNDPCEISWRSDASCENLIKLKIDDQINNLESEEYYSISDEEKSHIETSTNFISFDFLKVGETKDTTITIIARNRDQVINNVSLIPDDNLFELLNPMPIMVSKDIPLKLSLRFTAKDTLLRYSRLRINSSSCSYDIGLLTGSKNQVLSNQSLKLTHPKGGEIFIAGNDTNITWEGISEKENICIEFSADSGRTWSSISNKSNNLSEFFKVPNLSSDSCLIRIEQKEYYEYGKGDLIWEKNFGGSSEDKTISVIETIDGGYLLAGYTRSNDSSITINGNSDYYVVKTDRNGKEEWHKTFGGSSRDEATSVILCSDGGYLISGNSSSNDFDVIGNNGNVDIWLIKLNFYGDVLWKKAIGGTGRDEVFSTIETEDSGFILVGSTNSSDGDISDSKKRSKRDIWIVKIDSVGVIEWDKCIGEEFDDYGSGIASVDGNDFIVISTKMLYLVNSVIKLTKINQKGDIIWDKEYGGSNQDFGVDIKKTFDDGFIFCGRSLSIDGDISNPKNWDNTWVVKIDSVGEIEWDTTIEPNNPNGIIQLYDGSFMVSDGKHSDFILYKLDRNGKPITFEKYGSPGIDYSSSILENSDRDIIIAGLIRDLGRDVSKYNGGGDSWLIKVAGETSYLQSDTSDAVFSIIMPEPVIQNNDIDMGEMIVGNTKDTIVSSVICNNGDAPLHVLGVDISTIYNSDDFLIPRGAGDFYLEKGECQDMMFEFTPSEIGNRTAFATIRATIGNFYNTINIRGVGINPLIEATTDVVDFGQFELGDSKDTSVVLIENVGSTDITITETRITGPDLEQFTLLTSPTNFIIPAGNNKELKLNYTARYGGRTSSIIEFHYDGVGSPLRSMLFAEGIGGEVYPQVPDAYVGDRVELGLHLGRIKPEGLNEVATNFSATVSYNSTLLAPIDKNMTVTTENTTSFIEIEGQLSGVSQIATVPMKVGLGTAVKSGLVVTEFQLYDANGDSVYYEIEPGVGEFNVLGICEEGGTRLVNPNGEKVGLRVAQNRLNTSATIYLDLIESGQTDLIIYDQLGNAIETAYSGTPSTGSKELSLDLGSYTNGRYYIKLTTPTITKTEIIEVVR